MRVVKKNRPSWLPHGYLSAKLTPFSIGLIYVTWGYGEGRFFIGFTLFIIYLINYCRNIYLGYSIILL